MATKSILRDLHNIQRKFLWSGSQESHKWALVKWDTVCIPKSQGGLRLRDNENAILVAGSKLLWRWITHTQEPWEKIWCDTYTKD